MEVARHLSSVRTYEFTHLRGVGWNILVHYFHLSLNELDVYSIRSRTHRFHEFDISTNWFLYGITLLDQNQWLPLNEQNQPNI